MNPAWAAFLKEELESDRYRRLQAFLKTERAEHEIYPAQDLVFHAFDFCEPQEVKVVILGQDPYHGQGQAHGLAFSVPGGVPEPPSLRNIFKKTGAHESGNLERWARQGVLLLNTVLTVRAHEPNSHKGHWEWFTDAVIRRLGERPGRVYMLWGAPAQRKEKLIGPGNLILKTSHPSPLSVYRGFDKAEPFAEGNAFLKDPVIW